MIKRPLNYLVAFSTGLAATASYAAESTVNLSDQGFCLRKSENKCEEVAMNGTLVTIERLSKGPDGKRIVYFYSDQNATGKGAFVHVVESEDSDPDVTFKDSSGAKATPSSALKAIVEKLKPAGAAVITAFQLDKSDKVRVFSAIQVDGPGVLSGRVLDISGQALGGGERASFTVIRDPGPNARSQEPVSSGYDDGYE